MPITLNFTAAAPMLALLALAVGGCAHQSDVATVGRYGGYTTTGYDGVLRDLPPMDAVDFSTQRAIVTDDDIEAMLPALKRLAPRRISLGGQKISDRSVDMLNEIPFLRVVNVEGTNITPAGWARLRPSRWD
jgi:hypothetical protein